MAKLKRAESSFIALDILDTLHAFGYPKDSRHVKINTIPVLNATGRKIGNIDIVYYHGDEPVLLIESKREDRNPEKAKKQAQFYLNNFPSEEKEYCPSGKPPKYFATTVGKEIFFFRREYDKDFGKIIAVETDFLDYSELLKKLGLARGPKIPILKPEEFKPEFFDELVDVFRSMNRIISKEVVEKIVAIIYSYICFEKKFTLEYPYNTLNSQKKKWVHDLFNRFDLIRSLTPELAKEFRKCMLRAFQGKTFNQYMTDESIIKFMCALTGKLSPSIRMLDFECGSGGFLAEAVEHWHLPLKNIKGIDIDELPYYISKTYLAIYFRKKGKKNIDAISILHDNGLFNHGSNYDLVLGNPAGSNKYKHGHEKRILDDGLKDLRGKAVSFKEYDLSVQQAVRSCKPGGKICLILPDGFFSISSDDYLRELVAAHCKVLAIVSLPKGVFKRGKDTRTKGQGASTATMKMSILFAEKYAASKRKHKNDYKVFLASIAEPSSTKGEISNWMKQPLDVVLHQWKNWLRHKRLEKIPQQKHLVNATAKILKQIMN